MHYTNEALSNTHLCTPLGQYLTYVCVCMYTRTYKHIHKQVLREKLLYAIHHCTAIDNDFTVSGTVLLDNEVDEEPAREEYTEDGQTDALETDDQESDMSVVANETGRIWSTMYVVCDQTNADALFCGP
jgi:hypothetical protein